jgi:polyhydroxybutyrate depolymerase
MLTAIGLILLLTTSLAQNDQINKAKVIAATPESIVIVGDSNKSITVDGVERSYILHIPPGYSSSTHLPLVFVLHGMGGTAESFKSKSGMSAKADQENFVAVYPNALGNPSVWNSNLSDISSKGVDDVGFIRVLLDRLEHDLRIDRRRVYCSGFSSGAIMSYLLGAKLSHRLAAIGIVSGTVGNRAPDGKIRIIPTPFDPVPVIAFHGRKDGTIYYDGGGSMVNCLPVADSIKFWVSADGCVSSPQKTTKPNDNLRIDDYGGCKDGSEVILYTFKNGTHEWPSLQNNDNFSATDSMWEFFVHHPRR